VVDLARIDELRRRVQKDPSSIAFAQLAEEFRRAGRLRESVETCEAGLGRHPGYLSARVTLGRALLDLGDLDKAQDELQRVLRAAPENLAALRGLAEIHHRRGELEEALSHYEAALELARHDPELERLVHEISAQLEPAASPLQGAEGSSLEDLTRRLGSMETSSADERLPVAAVEPEGERGTSGPVDEPAPRSDSPRPDVEALERWLEAIVEERERRQ
jgi:tetratricopeptide (TPR) repeat protein